LFVPSGDQLMVSFIVSPGVGGVIAASLQFF
jgi:hypothetical protein